MSTGLMIGLCVFAGLLLAALVWAAVKSDRPLRRIFGSSLQGVCALGAVNLLGAFTGVSLGFGYLSAGVSILLGLPGVISLLIMRLITLI